GSCVERYPTRSPACPFCGGKEIDWTDGDSSIYGGDGTCKGCGAELSIRDLNEISRLGYPVPSEPALPATGEHPRIAHARVAAETMVQFLEERVKAGHCKQAFLHVEATIDHGSL